MTILGALVRPDRALLWADSEVYDADRASIGIGAKLAVNPLGIAVAGSMRLLRKAARSVQASASIDHAERRLPAELRIAAAKLAPGLVRADQSWCSGQVIIAAGFSPAAGRMVGWRFDGPGFFEGILLSSFLLPADAGLERDIRQVQTIRHIVDIARQQIGLLRQRLPDATGKDLIVVELTETDAHCMRIPEFAAGLAPFAVLSAAEAEPFRPVCNLPAHPTVTPAASPDNKTAIG